MATADPTTLFTEWRQGNRAALDELFPLVYEDLRRRAHACLRGERNGHTLSTPPSECAHRSATTSEQGPASAFRLKGRG
jgi:hypothetical protein